jgi:hypothetical protein
MAYADLAKAWIGQNPALLDQIAGACLSCAVDVLNESGGTANHANRVIWANGVNENPYYRAKFFLVDVVSNSTIAAAIPDPVDADVKFVVASKIDTYATGV